jgi:hypothetical protein
MSAPFTNRSLPLNVLTGTRAALSVMALLMPRIGARIFRLDANGTAVVMARLFGVRNAVLAAGLLRLDTMTVPRTFIGINVLIDLVDALAFAAAGRRREIGIGAATLGAGTALGAAGLGAAGIAGSRLRRVPDLRRQ